MFRPSNNRSNSRQYNKSTYNKSTYNNAPKKTRKNTKLELFNVQQETVITRATYNAADTAHTVVSESVTKPDIDNNYVRRSGPQVQNRRKNGRDGVLEPKQVHDIAKKPVTKKSVTKIFKNNPSMANFNKTLSTFLKNNKKGILGGSAVIAGMWILNKSHKQNRRPNISVNQGGISFGRSSAYIPDSYKKGFNEIKEMTTDFGSKVHLDKTISKVMISPPNTTRQHFTTNTNSVINSNLALNAHSNAINHTRY